MCSLAIQGEEEEWGVHSADRQTDGRDKKAKCSKRASNKMNSYSDNC